jgi:hypothetical protein
MSNNLIPSYLETDFNTLQLRLKQLMQKSETFKDYNYEGSNISMLMELVSYIGDLNTFYTNILARNLFPDTANIYEVVHSQSSFLGFNPRGWRSPVVNLQINLQKNVEFEDNSFEGDGQDQIFIPSWFTIDTGLVNDKGDKIFYCTTKDHTFNIPATDDTSISFTIPLRQGEVEYFNFVGGDIIDHKINLPFYQFDHGEFPYREELPNIEVKVNGNYWYKIPDFYDKISGLQDENNVYKFVYNRYGRYSIQFSSLRNMPSETDIIEIHLLKSLGRDGSIGAELITESPINSYINATDEIVPFMKNIRPIETRIIDVENYTVTNLFPSIGGSEPDKIDQLKNGAKLSLHSQQRNVNRFDYINNLETHNDIAKANAWGEQEQNPGNTEHYNKVYLSVIPYDLIGHIDTITIPISASEFSNNEEGDLVVYDDYYAEWRDDLLKYIEPRRHLNTDEIFIVPEIVYFKFDLGVKIKRIYRFENIKNDLLNKLEYYFDITQRSFNEIIDFRDIHNFLLDTEIRTNDYRNINGINSLVFRNIVTYVYNNTDPLEIYPVSSDDYPRYTKEDYGVTIDNILRPIKIGFNQFPLLKKEYCLVENET